jgi:hypothetical protein
MFSSFKTLDFSFLHFGLGFEMMISLRVLCAKYHYEVGSITNANAPISQQLRNIAQKFKKAAQTTFISCTEKKSFVC